MNDTRDERPDDYGSQHLACESARSMVPGYLDGELSEPQAGPLRAHLLACPACREMAKDERNLKGWFAAAAPSTVEAPPGFAARVARRAFAGDPGLLSPVAPPGEERAELMPYVLRLTVVAAILLLVFSVAIHQARNLPAERGLEAEDTPPWERPLNNPGPAVRKQPPRGPAPAEESRNAEAPSEDDR